ncbi:UNVERIFIED_ORG: acetolactate synthase regulatory subunit [Rhizobium etli]
MPGARMPTGAIEKIRRLQRHRGFSGTLVLVRLACGPP